MQRGRSLPSTSSIGIPRTLNVQPLLAQSIRAMASDTSTTSGGTSFWLRYRVLGGYVHRVPRSDTCIQVERHAIFDVDAAQCVWSLTPSIWSRTTHPFTAIIVFWGRARAVLAASVTMPVLDVVDAAASTVTFVDEDTAWEGGPMLWAAGKRFLARHSETRFRWYAARPGTGGSVALVAKSSVPVAPLPTGGRQSTGGLTGLW